MGRRLRAALLTIASRLIGLPAPAVGETILPSSARRIMFLSSCVRGGGAGWSLYYLLKNLDRSRIEPLVVVPAKGIFEERLEKLGICVIEMPQITERTNRQLFRSNNRLTVAASTVMNSISSLSCIPRIARLIKREHVEVVHCNNMLVKTIGAVAAQVAGVPAVLHARNLHESRGKQFLYGNLAKLTSVRLIISNSEATAAPYQQYAPNKITVVWNGVDLEEYGHDVVREVSFRRELGLDERTTLVGFTGNLIPRKGLETLLRAAASVLARRPSAYFVAIGRVPIGNPVDHKAEYEALAKQLGIADRFHFAGFRDDVRSAVRDFDVLVAPSFQEPFGRSIIEAMALGTPVVASRVGGIPEILTHDHNGLLVEPGDVNGLADALERLISSPDLRGDMSRAAQRTVRDKFDVVQLTRMIEDLLMEV